MYTIWIYFNGHFRNLNWRYLPYEAYIRPKFQGISPQNMAKNMVLTYLHLLDPEIPIEYCTYIYIIYIYIIIYHGYGTSTELPPAVACRADADNSSKTFMSCKKNGYLRTDPLIQKIVPKKNKQTDA